jgi:transcriptional regulator with XRE-family HTH domain
LTPPVSSGIDRNMDEPPDKVMIRVRELFEASGLTLDELGKRMGYGESSARKSVWQFVKSTNDPRVSMLRKFAEAMGISVADLFAEKKEERVEVTRAKKDT